MHKIRKNFIPILTMIIIFIVDFSLLYIIHTNWDNSMKKYFPLKNEIQNLSFSLTQSHLWFEEAIGGDKSINLEKDVMEGFRHKRFSDYITEIEAVLNTNTDRLLYERLLILDDKADNLYEAAIYRWDFSEKKIGNEEDQSFDKIFNSLILELHNFSILLDKKINKEFENKEALFSYIVIFFLSINLLVFIVLYKLKHQFELYTDNIYEEKEKAIITLESIGDAVITTDSDGYITYLNPIAQKLTAYSNKEAVGKYLDIVFNIINETTRKPIETPVQKVLTEGIIVGLANHTALIDKNGKEYSIEDSAAPIRNKNKEIIGTVLVFHDVTKQKNVREKLSENEKILVQQSKMAAMGEMIENIAHQWRQPLSLISTTSTGVKLKKELNDLDDEYLIKSLDMINNSSQHLSKTIDDFRGFFKPDKKKEVFNISNSYTKTINLISSKLLNREIEVIENINSFEINGFENELVQVLMNIFNNSIDILEKKEGLKVILIDIFKIDDLAYIKVMDNAGGINENIIDRVFEPYFTTKNQSQGTGIGLYMTEEIIVKHMHGSISVVNKSFNYTGEEYTGALFEITLPINKR